MPVTNLELDKTRPLGIDDHRPDPAANVLLTIAADLVGASGADVEKLLRDARQHARRQRHQLTYSDIRRVIDETRPPLSPEIIWRRSVHEAGHVIARLKLQLGDVQVVTINGAHGGSYVENSFDINEIQSEQALSGLLTIILAGRAAEMVVFGTPSLGSGGSANSDLARATEIARDLETRLGCSGVWPLLYQTDKDLGVHNPGLPERIHQRLDAAYQSAIALLTDHQPILVKFAQRLAHATTIDGATVKAILGITNPGPRAGTDNFGIDPSPLQGEENHQLVSDKANVPKSGTTFRSYQTKNASLETEKFSAQPGLP